MSWKMSKEGHRKGTCTGTRGADSEASGKPSLDPSDGAASRGVAWPDLGVGRSAPAQRGGRGLSAEAGRPWWQSRRKEQTGRDIRRARWHGTRVRGTGTPRCGG